MAEVYRHPSHWLSQYLSYLKQLLIIGLGAILWAFIVSIITIQEQLLGWEKIGLLYSWLATLYGLYIILSVMLSHFLSSLKWLQTAALLAAWPGLGFFFGLFQIHIAFKIFSKTRQQHWQGFFVWYCKKDYSARRKN